VPPDFPGSIAEMERLLDEPTAAAEWGRRAGLADPQSAHRALCGLAAHGLTLDLLAFLCGRLAELLPAASDPDRVLVAMERLFSAVADLGHYLRSGERPVEVIRLLKGRLYGIHLKDFAEMQDKTKGVILGKGHIDVPAVMGALVAAGFPADGALSIEYEENPQNPLADIKACEQAAREAIAGL
jgi:sugar phosphate isomerase/epimerase